MADLQNTTEDPLQEIARLLQVNDQLSHENDRMRHEIDRMRHEIDRQQASLSQQPQAEAALSSDRSHAFQEQINQQLQVILNAMPAAVVVYDAVADEFTLVNQRALAL